MQGKVENSLGDRITSAVHLYEAFGPLMMKDAMFRTLLFDLDRYIGETQRAMEVTGIAKECADCAVNGEGTCCGIRTGSKCSNTILFINLMMGKILPRVPAYPGLCHFLTAYGCSLRARPVICVNFTCRRLRDRIPHKALCGVQEIAGKEIHALFIFEEYVKKKMTAASGGAGS